MFFHADITFVLALIALAYGALLVLKSKKYTDAMATTCKIIGIIVAVFSILMALSSGQGMIRMHMMKCAMMHKMMYQRPMASMAMNRKIIKTGMYKKMQNMKTPTPAAPAKK